MIKDFAHLLRHLQDVLKLVNGVILALLAALGACASLLVAFEGLSVGEALYLTAVTGLTVGYGDLAPVTAIGRIASVVIGLIGVIFVGIIVAVVNRALATVVEAKRSQEQDCRGTSGRSDRNLQS